MNINKFNELKLRLESTTIWQEYEKLVKASENKDLKAEDLITIISVLAGYNSRLVDEINEIKEKNTIMAKTLKLMEREINELKEKNTIMAERLKLMERETKKQKERNTFMSL